MPSAEVRLNNAPARQRILVWLAICLAAALFLTRLRDDLFGDEVGHTYHVITQGNVWRSVLDPSMCHPPLYFLLAKVCYLVLGAGWAMRLPSLVAALATIFLAGKLAGRCFGPPYVVPAAFVAALSPFLGEFATEGRAYGLMIFFATATLYAFVRYTEEKTARHAAVLVLCAAGGAWTHYFFYFFLISLALYHLLVIRRVTGMDLGVGIATVIATLPFPLAVYFSRGPQFRDYLQVEWTGTYFSPVNFLARVPAALAFGYSAFRLPPLNPGRTVTLAAVQANWPVALAMAVAFAGLAAGCIVLGSKREKWFGLLAIAFVVPTALGTAAGISGLYLIREKHLAALWILLVLAVVRAFGYLRGRRPWGWLPIGAYAAVVAVSLTHFLIFPSVYSRRVNWSGLSATLEGKVSPADAVVFYEYDFAFHVPGVRPPATKSAAGYTVSELVRQTGSVAAAAGFLGNSVRGRIFVIDDETDRNDVDPQGVLSAALRGDRTLQLTPFGRNLALSEFGARHSGHAMQSDDRLAPHGGALQTTGRVP